MPFRMGLLGKKVGMLQDFDDKGNWACYTVVETGPCVVLDIKTKDRDGYCALKLGFDEQKAHRVNRPQMGVFAQANTTPKRIVREFRLSEDEIAQFEVGQTLAADQVFKPGDTLDVSGVSKGKGFQGVMKRYHFSGFRATHGTHEYFRHGGSIGCRLTPGRVVKGRKMPGQMGNKRVTVQNVVVGKIITDKNVVLVKGSVPGAPGSYVTLRHASKRDFGPFELIAPVAPEPEAEAEAPAEA
jgi:large subunit ribosomal protein L3